MRTRTQLGQGWSNARNQAVAESVLETPDFAIILGMKTQELKQLSEHMDRQIAKQFDEYRKFDDYVKQEVRHTTSQMYKTLGILGTAVAVVLSVGGYFGLPFFVRQKVQDILQEATAREALATLSNQVVSVVQARVPTMIESQVGESSLQLRRMFDEQMSSSAIAAQARIDAGIAKAEAKMGDLSGDMAKLRSKLELLDVVVAAKAGNRQGYDRLRQEMVTTNETATLARDAVAEIEWRYQQRRYSYGDYHPMLQRPDFKLGLDSLVDIVHCDFDWNCDGAINELVETHDKGFVDTLVHAALTSKRLETVYTSIEGLRRLTGQPFKPLGADEVQKWWDGAKTNESYHSGYETFHGITVELREKRPTTVGEVVGRIKMLEDLLARRPKLVPAWKYIVWLVVDIPEQYRFLDGRKELCEKALERIEGLEPDKIEVGLLKTLYLMRSGAAADHIQTYVNGLIKQHPDFESRAVKSKMFTEAFFKAPGFNWMSKQQVVATTMPKEEPTRTEYVSVKKTGCRDEIESGNCVGFMSVTIRKGRRALLEMPFGKSKFLTRDKLGSIVGCVAGDEISWTMAGRTMVYQYDGVRWNDANGGDAAEVDVPVGDAVIYYDRKSNRVTSISFSGHVGGIQ